MDIPELVGQCQQAAWTIGELAKRLSLKDVFCKNRIRTEEACVVSSYEEGKQFRKMKDKTVTIVLHNQ